MNFCIRNFGYCYFEEDKNFLSYWCCKIPKGYSFNSSNIRDNDNIVEITLTQHYTRLAQNRFSEQRTLGNDRMETGSTAVALIRL